VNQPSSLNVARGIDPRLGGTSVSIPAIARYTGESSRVSAELAVFRTAQDEGSIERTGLPASSIHQIPWDPFSPSQVIDAYKRMSTLVKQHDVLQIHGICESHTAMTAYLARATKTPYIISAHGMLDPWALRNKRWKKTIYSTFAERPNLRRAACLRALTAIEVDNYRAFGLRVPIAVIPNGVVVPKTLSYDAFLVHGNAGIRNEMECAECIQSVRSPLLFRRL
jgi:glycosyltransferase involved in cell wall biosynthesis